MSYVYTDVVDLIGLPIVDDGRGNHRGECVSLVKKYGRLPNTPEWTMGASVRGNLKIKPGTVIATFFDGKTYKGHAAFYLCQDSDGITVVDQYQGLQKVQKRKIRFKGKREDKDGVNDGDSYSIVE